MLSAIRHKIKSIPSWVLWGGLALVGLFIIVFNDAWGDVDEFIVFGLFYSLVLMVSVVRWIISQIKSIIILKRDKAKMEMLHLKSQVSPHFFFNTLNNLYGQVEKNPKEAQLMILKLSDLMRYSIYEGQKEWVSLEEEIAYLNNFIDLHKDRYHKKVRVEFNVNSDREDYRIMPLLLILLVENSFKHGVEKLRTDAFVDIKLTAIDGSIHFDIKNNYDLDEVDEDSAGIGLDNLKRRLEIGYEKDYSFSITKENNIFEAQVSLLKV